MAQMTISVPEALKQWAERRVADGRYANISDYVRDLIRRDQELDSRLTRLQAEIDKGFGSGASDRNLEEIYDDFRKRREAA